MVLDTVWTASTIPAGIQTPAQGGTRSNPILESSRVVWTGFEPAGATVLITDINGNPILQSDYDPGDVTTGREIVLWNSPVTLKFKQGGWILQTLTSGKILIYH